MKKRILPLLILAALLLSLIAGASGTELICFVGVNDTIPLSLPGEASPHYDNGLLYVPYTAFDASPNSVFTSYNADQNTFVIANRGQRLVYDLLESTVTDENGTTTEVQLSYRGGLLFIPGEFAADHFGLQISLLTSKTGCPILRFTNGEQVYDDTQFVTKAETLIAYMLEHYAAKEEDRPQNPDIFQDDPKRDPEDDPERLKGKGVVYLAFAGNAVAEETVKHLEALDAKAIFFLTEQQILDDPALVQQIYGKGHAVGLTVKAGEQDVPAALHRTNEALDHCLFLKSVQAMVPSVYSQSEYILWNEAEDGSTVEEILANPEIPHLFICQDDVLNQLKMLAGKGKIFPLLLETTTFPADREKIA